MSAVLRPLPVVYACQGCPEFGEAARVAGAFLDSNGAAETVWLGAPDLRRRSRYPAIALDGCERACALRWLKRHGIPAERHYVLPGDAARLAADVG